MHVEAQIVDGAQMLCTALAVFGKSRSSVLAIRPPPPAIACDADQAIPISRFPGISPGFTRYVEQRLARGALPFAGDAEPRTQIWVRYLDEPVVDDSLVIAMADTIPSPALSVLTRPAPASSLSWTLELLDERWPESGRLWWLMDAHATAAIDGYVFQTATLWSQEGQAIALSRQSAAVFG